MGRMWKFYVVNLVVNKVNYELHGVTNGWEAFIFCYENQTKYTNTFCTKRVGLKRCSRRSTCTVYCRAIYQLGNILRNGEHQK